MFEFFNFANMRKLICLIIGIFLTCPVAFADTLTVYPDASTGATTCDAQTLRSGVNETFATITAGAGTSVDTTSVDSSVLISTSSTTNQFNLLARLGFTFDTSSIGTGSITSATLSLQGQSGFNDTGTNPDYDIVSFSPATDNNIIASDHSNFGSTTFASINQSAIAFLSYNDFSLDSNGIANIDGSGITGFGARNGWDVDGTYGATWGSFDNVRVDFYLADNSGTTRDPKLVVEYSLATDDAMFFGVNF